MAELAPGTVVDRYTVEAPLGQGGMAMVYLVRHEQLGTRHALKILTLSSRSIRERLLQEGRVQASLRHPNIVAVTDVVTVDDAPGLVMEYIAGPSLEEFLLRHRLTLPQADALAREIIAGVSAAHRRGLIHRDLKPANVLLEITDHGLVAKVADFGLAKLVGGEAGGHTRTRSGVTMGTPAYMAPEQIRDAKNVDARADVFSTGCILYELVTGQRAFHGADVLELFTAVASGRYTPPQELVPDLPERMVHAITGALQVDRDARLPDCDALLAAWTGRDVPRAAPARSGPWSGSILSEAGSLGSHAGANADSAADTQRSRPGSEPTVDFALGGPGASVASAAVAAHAEVPAEVPFDTATLDWHRAPDPSMAPSPPATRSRSSLTEHRALWLGAPLALAGLLALGGMVLVGGALGAAWLLREPGDAGDVVPVEDAATVEAPGSEPVDDAPADDVTDDPGAAEPPAEPPTRATTPAIAVTPDPTPRTAPAPRRAAPEPRRDTTPDAAPPARSTDAPSEGEADAPTRVARPPEPEPEPEPQVVPEPEVQAAPEPPPAPTGPPAGKGRVVVEGDGRVWLTSPAGRFRAGDLAPGEYDVVVFFDGKDPIPTGRITLRAGQTVTLRCFAAMRICRAS